MQLQLCPVNAVLEGEERGLGKPCNHATALNPKA